MEEMENEILELNEKTQILQNKCESLQAINESLLEKNQKLDQELEQMRQQLMTLQKQQANVEAASKQSGATCASCESQLLGSAVSNYTDPLQQGSKQKKMDSQLTQEHNYSSSNKSSLESLWKIVALCLLYKTCSSTKTKSSMPINLRNLQKVCLPISQQTWKQIIEKATRLLPKLQAEKSDCLDQWWG